MDFTNPQYLVTTAWLADNLDDPDVRILDVTAKLTGRLENRAEADCFAVGHIPGSVFFDVPSGKGVLSDQSSALPWMWPGRQQMADVLASVGVGQDTRVVLAARTPRDGIDSGTMWCTRAWWTLHHYGVDCAILHGGLEQWEAEGGPMTDKSTNIPPVEPFVPGTDWERGRATKADVLAAVEAATEPDAGAEVADGPSAPACLVDALPSDSFDGSGTAYGPRAGHITGAVNLPFRSLVEAETAGFVDPATMHRRLNESGLLTTGPVITYCGGAIAATVDAFALALFGKSDVSVYDGSLMEWSADPLMPMTNPTGDRS